MFHLVDRVSIDRYDNFNRVPREEGWKRKFDTRRRITAKRSTYQRPFQLCSPAVWLLSFRVIAKAKRTNCSFSSRYTGKENIQGPPFSRSHIPRILLWVSVVNERCKNTWIQENINPSIYLSIVYIDRNR